MHNHFLCFYKETKSICMLTSSFLTLTSGLQFVSSKLTSRELGPREWMRFGPRGRVINMHTHTFTHAIYSACKPHLSSSNLHSSRFCPHIQPHCLDLSWTRLAFPPRPRTVGHYYPGRLHILPPACQRQYLFTPPANLPGAKTYHPQILILP
jgi:hypothetical protein